VSEDVGGMCKKAFVVAGVLSKNNGPKAIMNVLSGNYMCCVGGVCIYFDRVRVAKYSRAIAV
jgi:hypothetical protein